MLHLFSNSRSAPMRASLLLVSLLAAACSDTTSGDGAPSEPAPEELNWPCEIADDTDTPDYLTRVGCRADFEKLGAQPTDASIPGALSGKVIVDQCPEGTLGCDG